MAPQLRINKGLLGEYSKVVFVPYTRCKDLVCKDKSHKPRKVLLWFIEQSGERLEERIGICMGCKKLYVILGKE